MSSSSYLTKKLSAEIKAVVPFLGSDMLLGKIRSAYLAFIGMTPLDPTPTGM